MSENEYAQDNPYSRRLKGWEKTFAKLVEIELAKPFDWGTANCANVMATAVIACHGPDHPVLKILEEYDSEEGARAVLAKYGSLEDILFEYFEVVPVFNAQTADIALVKTVDADGAEVVAGCVMVDGVAAGKSITPVGVHSRYTFRVPVFKIYKTFKV